MKDKVYIVVLNWNREDLTIECVKSIRKMNLAGCDLKVVVVDNASRNVEGLKKLKGVELIENKQNLGFAGGNNVGIKFALVKGADYVMVLNNDALVDENLLLELLKVAEKKDKFGAASPKIYFAKGFEFHKSRYKKSELGRVIWYAGGVVDWDNVYGSGRGVDEVDKGQYDKVEETEVATGTCVLLSSKAIKEVGMFDEKYYMYYEDTDLSQRMKRKGYGVYYVPGAVVKHKVSQSSGIGSELNDYFTTRNRMVFGMKYAKLRTKFALVRESVRLLFGGRKWQRIGIKDYYLGRFGRGSWK